MGQILKDRLKMSKFESPAHEAVLRMMVAASHLRAEMDRRAAEFGISAEQYNILRILRGAHPEGHACGEIGERMIDRSPDITRRIDALEKQGLAKRERSEEDRRMVYISITKKGLALLEKMSEALKPLNDQLAAKLTQKECEELSRLCEKIFVRE
jgi:DNA-binding MarR family transcriptional regulator